MQRKKRYRHGKQSTSGSLLAYLRLAVLFRVLPSVLAYVKQEYLSFHLPSCKGIGLPEWSGVSVMIP